MLLILNKTGEALGFVLCCFRRYWRCTALAINPRIGHQRNNIYTIKQPAGAASAHLGKLLTSVSMIALG